MVRPVYLVPYYTEDVGKACTSFKVIRYGEEGYDHRFKIPTGLKSGEYPCLISICDKNIQNKISQVQLVRVNGPLKLVELRVRCGAAGATRNILGSAHTDHLFLMWK